tara:strand:+ start:17757 stop:26054 length:8298 start_codon:yes stop_codon:yes gene_type:complete
MGTKSFFNKQKSQEVKLRGQEKSTIDEVSQNVESIEYLKEYSESKFDFVPQLDFQDPANFVKYGSAKDYYVDLVDSVVQSYPYDGSLAERLKYYNSLVAIQKHEFDKNYPRSVGYADFTDSSYSNTINDPFAVGTVVFGLGESTTQHYVITDNYSNKLVYNTSSNQVGSLELDFSTGATVEFWMKKDAFPVAAQTQNEVIFSISNEESDVFQVVTDVTASSKIIACFAKQSSSAEFLYEFNTNLTRLDDSTWHHYALAFSTSSTGYVGEIYVDGAFQEKKFYTNGSPKLVLTGTLDATVAASSLPLKLGDGKLSGSIDEVRLWKTTRDAKQVGVNYFFDVGGGGNTDTAKVNNDNPLGLSLYYRFNEGNTGITAVDNIVLDYSGRLTDGVWVGYNTTGHTSRPTGSAIIESGVATEVGSPIIYSTHPTVVSYKADKTVSGSAYDVENLGSMYNMLPSWISDEDAANGLLIRKMVQIMSSYLDTLHAQITAISQLQDGSYVSGSNAKPNPFSKRNLISYGFDIPDVFIDSGVIEEIYFKDEKRIYEDKLFNLKNLIFQNIFNNLNYINKTKGTEKSFRNLFRCFGVDDELVRLNMYADNQEYEIRENYQTSQAKRNVIDFSGYKDGQNREGVVYTFADSSKSIAETGDSGYIPSSSNQNIPLTFESQFQFPKFINFANGHLDSLSRASLFGVHSASKDTTVTTFGNNDLNFKVYADTNSNNSTKFVLETNIGSVSSLESSFYENVYDNTEWTFAVRTKPREYPYSQEVTSSDVIDLEFYGVNYAAGYKVHEFSASAEVNLSDEIGQFLTGSDKRMYVGADRTNITGSLNNKSNVRALSSRVWFDYVENEELRSHARDITTFGRLNPYRNSFIYENGESGSYIPRINTLALHWNFENITGSDSTGKFLVQDITSGSSYAVDPRFAGGEYSKYVGPNYSGQGALFSNSSTKVVDFLFSDTAEQQLPENLYSSDLVEIREGDDTLFTRESRPSKYYFAVETSLYDTISREMLGFFASIKDFNSLIGSPENLFRTEYKSINKLRELFFENIENEPDLDKFINLYKWLDGALDSVLSNLIPASAQTSDKVRNIVESHILERSKYQHKYLQFKEFSLEDKVKSEPQQLPPGAGTVEFITIGGDVQDGGGGPDVIPMGNTTVFNRNIPSRAASVLRNNRSAGLRTDRPASELVVKTTDFLTPAPGTFFGSPLDQGTKPLWYLLKVDREPGGLMTTGDISADFSRVQSQVNQTQTTTGSRQEFYAFAVDAKRSIGKHTTYAGENRENYFPVSFKGSQDSLEDGIKIEIRTDVENRYGDPYYQYEGGRDTTFNDEKLTPVTVTDLSNQKILAGQNYLPFVIISSSATPQSDYQKVFTDLGMNIDIKMSHQDFVVEGGGLQGIFTDDHVGGWMYRHDNLFVTDENLRKEGYALVPSGSNTIYLVSPRFRSASSGPAYDENQPYGAYLKDGAAQRPVNIKNLSGSNFFKDYEIIQTTGRRINNRYYVKSSGFTGSVNATSSISFDEDGVFFYKDFTVLDRTNTGSNDYIIVNRFSAPGGPEVNSFAFLDVESAELSVYNNLNYRNLVVRIDNNELLTRHALTGGYDSVLLQPTGAYYKSYRNGVYKISASLETPEPIFDNSYVGNGIPRTDVQYSWIASSWRARKTGYPNSTTLTNGLLTASGKNPVYGQNESNFDYNISSSDYSPIYGFEYSDNITGASEGHIEYGVGSGVPVSVAFNATNYIIVGDVDLSKNLFTTASAAPGNYYNLPDFDAPTAPFILNGLLLSNNGPYQYPSFKQIRGGEHRVGREFWQQNLYVNNRDKVFVDENSDRLRRIKLGDKISITQAPVTNKYKPITQLIDSTTGSVEYALGNDLDYYAKTYNSASNFIENLNEDLNAPTRDIFTTDFYKFSSKFGMINYAETVYPRQQNQYLGNTRERNNYVSFWVSDELSDRTNQTIVNSQGYSIDASNWAMDVSLTGAALNYQPERSGELMRNTGSTGVGEGLGEVNARYSFNMGECRPNNLVQQQAGTGAFYTTYGEFAVDTRLVGQDETLIPEFAISDFINTVITENNGDFLNKEIYGFTLTGSESLVGNSFAERYGRTEQITYLKQLKDFYGQPTGIKLTFNATKKLLPREGFYPQQRVIQLAQQFSASYKDSTITIGQTNFTNPTGPDKTWSTALMPFWAPGVGLNSIKAGFAVDFAYKSTGSAHSSGGINYQFDATAPFESILSPSEHVSLVYHIQNSGSTSLKSTASVNKTDGVYEMMSHNFFAEVPDFFLEDLVSFKSAPQRSWTFEGPLSSSAGVKKFAMDVYIEDPVDFLMYGNGAAFGPFPYNNHAPPGYYWNSSGVLPGDYCTFLTNLGGNRAGYTRATIVFDPTKLLSSDAKTGQTSFSLQDIAANSTIVNANFLVERDGVSPADTVFMTLTSSLDFFVQDEEDRWTIRSKWECPILNFSDVPAETGGSDTAVEGMWHQYGNLAGSNARKRLNVRIEDSEYIGSDLTGSLLSAVGFEQSSKAFGKMKPKAIVEESVCCIPFVVDPKSGKEIFFEIPIEQFEKSYRKVRNGEVTEDSLMDMIRKMDKYVVPPVYDFVNIRDAADRTLNTKTDFEPGTAPFSMYLFEFTSELTRQDLANIWQGVMPSIATSAEKETVSIEHPIEEGELLSPSIFLYNGFPEGFMPNNIRWKIFKVKKRAKYDYYEMLSQKTNSPVYKNSNISKAGRFSFNYPYDQFSLVELGKLDAEFQVVNEKPDVIKNVPLGYLNEESPLSENPLPEETTEE